MQLNHETNVMSAAVVESDQHKATAQSECVQYFSANVKLPNLDAVRVQQLVAADMRVRLHATVDAAEIARDARLRRADRYDSAKRVGGVRGVRG